MNRVFKPYLEKFIIVFFNEILVYLKSEEKHVQHLRITLSMLLEHQFNAKFSKCEFWMTKVHFLGHVVSYEGIQLDP